MLSEAHIDISIDSNEYERLINIVKSKEHIYIDELRFQELLVRLEEIEWEN